MLTRPVRIRSVEPTNGTTVTLEFTNGERRNVDLAPYLVGPVFDAIRTDPDEFRRVSVDPELGTIVWPSGADIDPDVLFKRLRPVRDATQSGA